MNRVDLPIVKDYVISATRQVLSNKRASNEKYRKLGISCVLNNLRIIILFEFLWNIGIKRLNDDNKIERLYLLK